MCLPHEVTAPVLAADLREMSASVHPTPKAKTSRSMFTAALVTVAGRQKTTQVSAIAERTYRPQSIPVSE